MSQQRPCKTRGANRPSGESDSMQQDQHTSGLVGLPEACLGIVFSKLQPDQQSAHHLYCTAKAFQQSPSINSCIRSVAVGQAYPRLAQPTQLVFPLGQLPQNDEAATLQRISSIRVSTARVTKVHMHCKSTPSASLMSSIAIKCPNVTALHLHSYYDNGEALRVCPELFPPAWRQQLSAVSIYTRCISLPLGLGVLSSTLRNLTSLCLNVTTLEQEGGGMDVGPLGQLQALTMLHVDAHAMCNLGRVGSCQRLAELTIENWSVGAAGPVGARAWPALQLLRLGRVGCEQVCGLRLHDVAANLTVRAERGFVHLMSNSVGEVDMMHAVLKWMCAARARPACLALSIPMDGDLGYVLRSVPAAMRDVEHLMLFLPGNDNSMGASAIAQTFPNLRKLQVRGLHVTDTELWVSALAAALERGELHGLCLLVVEDFSECLQYGSRVKRLFRAVLNHVQQHGPEFGFCLELGEPQDWWGHCLRKFYKHDLVVMHAKGNIGPAFVFGNQAVWKPEVDEVLSDSSDSDDGGSDDSGSDGGDGADGDDN